MIAGVVHSVPSPDASSSDGADAEPQIGEADPPTGEKGRSGENLRCCYIVCSFAVSSSFVVDFRTFPFHRRSVDQLPRSNAEILLLQFFYTLCCMAVVAVSDCFRIVVALGWAKFDELWFLQVRTILLACQTSR